jgi:hypothetical protein
VYERALDTLEAAADRSTLATGVAVLNNCFVLAQTTPLRTCNSLLSLGSMPFIVRTMCIQNALCSLMHNLAMLQLEGKRELGDWEVVISVSAPALALSDCCC